MRTEKPIIDLLEKETRAGKKDRWVMTSKYPWYDNHGKVIGIWGISRDITELKEAQNLAEEKNERLLRALSDLDEFISQADIIRINLAIEAIKAGRKSDVFQVIAKSLHTLIEKMNKSISEINDQKWGEDIPHS